MAVLTHTPFTDLEDDLVFEFLDCHRELVEEVEDILMKMEREYEPGLVHELFRAMHSLKGNCRMVFLDPMVDIYHVLEELVSDLREGIWEYDPNLSVFLTDSVARLGQLTHDLAHKKEADLASYQLIRSLAESIHQASPEQRSATLAEAIAIFHGLKTDSAKPASKADTSEKALLSDADFFLQLATQLDAGDTRFKGRHKQITELCLAINAATNQVVDDEQLRVAVQLHDIGMAFLPDGLKQEYQSVATNDKQRFQAHLGLGYEIVRRFEGWQGAADIIRDHHEHYDGKGYPRGLAGNNIHPGARLLAIAEAFVNAAISEGGLSQKKALLRAIRFINSENGYQFDPGYVEVLNETIRRMLVQK